MCTFNRVHIYINIIANLALDRIVSLWTRSANHFVVMGCVYYSPVMVDDDSDGDSMPPLIDSSDDEGWGGYGTDDDVAGDDDDDDGLYDLSELAALFDLDWIAYFQRFPRPDIFPPDQLPFWVAYAFDQVSIEGARTSTFDDADGEDADADAGDETGLADWVD